MTQSDIAKQQKLLQAENVVRLELERRESKKRVLQLDQMLREVDQQALYVAQFKKEWLLHRQSLEMNRQQVVRVEAAERKKLEQLARHSLKRLYGAVEIRDEDKHFKDVQKCHSTPQHSK